MSPFTMLSPKSLRQISEGSIARWKGLRNRTAALSAPLCAKVRGTCLPASFGSCYYVFKDAGAAITLASPKGGQPPLDPKSDLPENLTELTKRFRTDSAAQAALANTRTLADVSAADFDAVFYPRSEEHTSELQSLRH